jgi:hypothetical protein
MSTYYFQNHSSLHLLKKPVKYILENMNVFSREKQTFISITWIIISLSNLIASLW